MVLCSFQTKDWKEWKNNRYSDIKKHLGVSDEENIYWFFSGRTVEETVANAFTVTANLPYYFVMAEVENFVRIDKIKWLKLCEREDHKPLTKEEWDDITNVENEAAVEYLVVGVPDNYIEQQVALMNYEEILEKCKDNENATGTLCSMLSDKNFDAFDEITEDLANHCHMEMFSYNEESVADKENTERMIALGKMAMVFKSVWLINAYYLGLSFIHKDVVFKNFGRKFISAEELGEIATAYAYFSMSTPEKDYDRACRELLEFQKRILKGVFCYEPIFKQSPNETCLCGSGKKYKKCCGKGLDIDIYKVMTADEKENERITAWHEKMIALHKKAENVKKENEPYAIYKRYGMEC